MGEDCTAEVDGLTVSGGVATSNDGDRDLHVGSDDALGRIPVRRPRLPTGGIADEASQDFHHRCVVCRSVPKLCCGWLIRADPRMANRMILVLDRYEHLCLRAARRAGLLAVQTQVARIGEETAVVVERYDRRLAGDGVVRVHQEDVCQALSVPPADKYQNEAGSGPREITGLLYGLMPSGAAYAASWRFADTLIWNWFTADPDAHARNCSILLAADDVPFAPLFDISSRLPYRLH